MITIITIVCRELHSLGRFVRYQSLVELLLLFDRGLECRHRGDDLAGFGCAQQGVLRCRTRRQRRRRSFSFPRFLLRNVEMRSRKIVMRYLGLQDLHAQPISQVRGELIELTHFS